MISCYLIGEDSLIIQCGNILLEQNYFIELVISPLPLVQDWAKKQGIYCLSDLKSLIAADAPKVDYIFSIVNSHILTNEVISLAEKGVINYHDSLLPKYAGLNSTTWAIINNEQTHGVSWHLVSEEIDAGDIVYQSTFLIEYEDSSLTLNLRCYKEAINTFNLLLDDLKNDKLARKPQNLQERTYFGRHTSLPNYGFVDWHKFSAEYIERLCRALTFGHYINSLGTVKISLGNNYLIIPKIEIAKIPNNSEPGTIIAIDESAIFIATCTTVIKCEHFISKEGVELSLEELQNCYGIYKGRQLKSVEYYTKNYSKILTHESYWATECKKLAAHTLLSSVEKINQDFQTITINLDLPKNEVCATNIVLSAVLIYLYRLNNYERASISIFNPIDKERDELSALLYSQIVPWNIEWTPTLTFEEVIQEVNQQLLKFKNYPTFLNDILVRYPELEGCSINTQIVINLSNHEISQDLLINSLFYIQYINTEKSLTIAHRLNEGFELLQHLKSHIETIVNYALVNPKIKLSTFCFLTPQEKNTLSHFSKGTVLELPNYSLAALFENQVILNPNKVAIKIRKETISYLELWEMSERIRQYLQTQNLPAQSFIGLYLQRSAEMLAVILGVLRADCVYVPLDTHYPFMKLENIIVEAELTHVITIKDYIEGLSNHFSSKKMVTWHCLEEILTFTKATSILPENKINSGNLESLAYIMFTSGTTGTPKGVMVSQKNVLNYCEWFSKTTQFNNNSTIDFSSSIAFDLSIPCTIAPLITGGTIAICDELEKSNPRLYLSHLKDKEVTHTELTPGYVELLLHYPGLVKKLTDLRFLLLGADVIHSPEVIKWLELCPNHNVINEYGPTETTVSATSYLVDVDEIKTQPTVPIGKPGFNSSCYVLDQYKNLCPLGMKGELYIGGMQVTKGYLRKPDLTNERFIKLSCSSNETCYRTGDLVRWLPQGNLQFYGRGDHQVKIQGYRIELAAIESVLLKHASIHQAVVVVQNESNKKHLRAYLISEVDIKYHEIKSFLSLHLPLYMIPKEFFSTDEVPLKENEKIDFERLLKQPSRQLSVDCQSHEDLNFFENRVLRIWQSVFFQKNVNIHDDFFELGGDSLSALHIATELSSEFQLNIPLHYVFEYATIYKFSAKIGSLVNCPALKSKKLTSLIKLSSGNNDSPLFLVHPVGGGVFWYKQLAKHLENKCTVYGIQDLSIEGSKHRFSTLVDMASFYLDEIFSLYQGESFCLGGASFGATVAFEMSQQLIRSNKKVNFLGLFDGWAEYPKDLLELNTIDLLTKKKDIETIPLEKMNFLKTLEEYRKSLLINYIPNIIHTNVSLFKANDLWDRFKTFDDPCNGWGALVEGNISVHITPGNHETMFYEPNVPLLAKLLLKALDLTEKKKFIDAF